MAWSTRELADLAGTTVKAVRHYHQLGLLAEPERGTNGYKQYQVAHLVRLLRIRRLVDLGLPLAQVAEVADADDQPEEALRLLDAELAAAVERLQRVRAELALILNRRVPADLPSELAEVAGGLADADRSLALVLTRVLPPEALGAYTQMLHSDRIPADDAFDNLAPDADEGTRREVAEQLAPVARSTIEQHPDVNLTSNSGHAAKTVVAAIRELYNPAQRDVLARIGQILATEHEPEPDA